MICSVCGNNYDDNVAFCPTCGAVNNSAAAPVDEPTIGSFDSLPPVMPQPVEAPVAEQQTAGAPVVAPEEPNIPVESQFAQAPIETAIPVAPQPEAVDTMAQATFVASVPQADIVAPVVAQPVAPAPAKKLKKPIIIGAVAALIVAIIVAVVLIFVLPGSDDKEEGDAKKAEGDAQTQSATYEVDSPLGDISAALEKTLFENSGMEFTIYVDGEEIYGAIGIGDTGKDSGFYFIDSDGYGFGLAEYVYHASWDPNDPMPDGFMEDLSEELSSAGLDIDIGESIDDVLNNKIDRDALAKLYNDNRADIEAMIEDETGESISLPEFDSIQQFFADFVNEGLTEDAISIEEAKDGDYTIYEMEINVAELAKCAYDYAKDDSEAKGILTLLGMVFGGSGSDYIGIIGDVIDAYEYDLDFEIGAEIVVNEDGYICIMECGMFGEEIEIEFSNFNNVEVTLDVLEETIEIMEYEDEPVEVEPNGDYYYVDDTFYGDAYIYADTYSIQLAKGDTAAVLIFCEGSELPSTFTFTPSVPDGISTSWGDWETDTSVYLYITADDYCEEYLTVYLMDEAGTICDYIEISVYVY